MTVTESLSCTAGRCINDLNLIDNYVTAEYVTLCNILFTESFCQQSYKKLKMGKT